MINLQDNAKVYNDDIKDAQQWTDRMSGNIRGVDKDSLNNKASFFIDPTSIPANKKFKDQ